MNYLIQITAGFDFKKFEEIISKCDFNTNLKVCVTEVQLKNQKFYF